MSKEKKESKKGLRVQYHTDRLANISHSKIQTKEKITIAVTLELFNDQIAQPVHVFVERHKTLQK